MPLEPVVIPGYDPHEQIRKLAQIVRDLVYISYMLSDSEYKATLQDHLTALESIIGEEPHV
jgi:hypothetical protein